MQTQTQMMQMELQQEQLSPFQCVAQSHWSSQLRAAGLLDQLQRFEDVVRTSDLPTLTMRAMRATAGELDVVMSELCALAHCERSWTAITKRSPFQIALYYVFFAHVRNDMAGMLDVKQVRTVVDTRLERGVARDATELQSLMQFGMAVLLLKYFVKPEKNKQLYIAVCGALASDCAKCWVTGSGQSKETNDRVRLYEVLGAPDGEAELVTEPSSGELSPMTGEWSDLSSTASATPPDGSPSATPVRSPSFEERWRDQAQHNPVLLNFGADDIPRC